MLRMSQFGIIEMTRQRMRPSLKRSIYSDCPHCKGAGLVKTPESMSLDVMRRLAIGVSDQRVARVELSVSPDVSYYLQNKKRQQLTNLENENRKRIIVRSEQGLGLDEMRLDEGVLDKKGTHPEFGPVTLRQMLATWTAHDLSHIGQIADSMARRYRDDVGPWRRFLPVLDRQMEDSG